MWHPQDRSSREGPAWYAVAPLRAGGGKVEVLVMGPFPDRAACEAWCDQQNGLQADTPLEVPAR